MICVYIYPFLLMKSLSCVKLLASFRSSRKALQGVSSEATNTDKMRAWLGLKTWGPDFYRI